MRAHERTGGRFRIQGVSLLELVVVMVLLAILGVAFLSMYGDVTRRNATGTQTAEMTWVGQGAMEALLDQPQPFSGAFPKNTKTLCKNLNSFYGIYQVSCSPSLVAKTKVAGTTYYKYLVTVSVTCVSGSCTPMTFSAYAYTI